jgi:hypothetical protein
LSETDGLVFPPVLNHYILKKKFLVLDGHDNGLNFERPMFGKIGSGIDPEF